MTPTKPYFIRALYDWILDNACTPYIEVDASYPRVDVPAGYAVDGSITLNISPVVTTALVISNEEMTFKTRFGGAVYDVYIPTAAIVAIYAQENGEGMDFLDDERNEESEYFSNVEKIAPENKRLYNEHHKSRFEILEGGKND